MTGWWSHVVVVSYAVPAAMVEKYLPPGPGGDRLEVETREEFGKGGSGGGGGGAVVSLVAQQCTNVRVWGIKWPFLNRYSALYLRVCVRHAQTRGVVYVREIVPNVLLARGARWSLNQPCVVAPVSSEVKQQTRLIGAEYRVKWGVDPRSESGGTHGPGSESRATQDAHEYVVRAVGTKPARQPGGGGGASGAAQSVESWLVDRPFVFGMDQKGRGLVYEVIHPSWGVFEVVDHEVRLDFGAVFGTDWGFLSHVSPRHVMLAQGSEAAVFPARRNVGVRWGVKRG